MGRNGWALSCAFEANEEDRELLARTDLYSCGKQEF